ncbi:MAG TPA: hypothetical protein VKE74_06885 [Gemmataceae bacterium]|nr:hypothetical protein [Gemmataceae bacterium]
MRRLLAVVALLLVVYIGAYYHLSRRGMAEAQAMGFSYFFYCPVADLTPGEDLPWQHILPYVLFDPINRLDRAWFDGGTPCRGVSWGLSR